LASTGTTPSCEIVYALFSSADEAYATLRRTTQTQNAQARVNFYGNGVALYGATGQSHGTFAVSLDGMPNQDYNATQVAFRPQQLLVSRLRLAFGCR
jgi:hypothetical protein